MNPLWAKAPRVLLGFPGLLAAIAAAIALLSFSVAAYPLFLSATENRLLGAGIKTGTVTRYGAGIHYSVTNIALGEPARPLPEEARFATPEEIGRAFDRRTGSIPSLGSTVRSIMGPEVVLSFGSETRPGRLMFRTDSLEHVEPIEGRDANGVWISDLTAKGLGLAPGDNIRVGYSSNDVEVQVDGIYRALYSEPPSGYWRNFGEQIFTQCADCSPPAPFVLMDEDRFREVTRALNVQDANFAWDAPLLDVDLSMDEARKLENAYTDLLADAGSEPLSEVLSCCSGGTFEHNRTNMTSSIGQAISQVDERVDALQVPARVVLVAAILVAFVAISGAGAYVVAARQAEARLLFARGQRRVAHAGKAALEALLPTAIGAVLGCATAVLLTRAILPEANISNSAAWTAARSVVIALPVAVIALATASTFYSERTFGEPHASTRRRFPWELVTGVMTIIAFVGLVKSGSPDAGGAVTRSSFYLLIFPILFLSTGAGLAARGFRRGSRLLTRLRISSPATYITLRRLAGAPRLVSALVCGCAIAAGLFVHATTISQSLDRTLEAKAQLFIGSDVAASVPPEYQLPDGFPHASTKVVRVNQAGLVDDRYIVDLIAVDPQTLPKVAYWDGSFGASSIEEPLSKLRGETTSSLPVVIASGDLPARFELDVGGVPFDLRTTDTVDAFPGMVSKRPLIVLDIANFNRVLEEANSGFLSSFKASTEQWIRGPTEAVLADLAPFEKELYQVLTAAEVADIPSFSAVIEAFRILNLLAVAAWAAILVVLLMYLQARRRSGVLSYALSRRMGLSHLSHSIALTGEIAMMLLFGYAIACGMGMLTASITASLVDPLRVVPPDTILAIPTAPLVVATIAIAVAAVVGAAATNNIAARTNLSSVMRTSD
jgi:hypothetical protein